MQWTIYLTQQNWALETSIIFLRENCGSCLRVIGWKSVLTGLLKLFISFLGVDGVPSVVNDKQEVWDSPTVNPAIPREKETNIALW